MTRRCIIEGCASKSGNPQHRGVTFHSFPFDSKTREVWLVNCRINPEKNITKSVLVCSRHFRRADFQPAKSNKYLLKQGAVPTIFPWGKFPPPAQTTTTAASEAAPQIALQNDMEVSATDTNESFGSAEQGDQVEKTALKRPSQDSSLPPDAKLSKLNSPVAAPTTSQDIQNLVPMGTIPAAAGGRKSETVSGFVPGVRLEAQDFDGIWHTARVMEVDSDEREVLIRFEKSGKSKGPTGAEEWIPMNSSRLRQKASAASKLPNVFVLGEKCLARWSGARRFPATVQKVLGNDMYEILFDDGYMKVLKSAHISKLKIPVGKSQSPSTSASPAPHKPIANSTPDKSKIKAQAAKKDWPLISMSSLNLAELNLPEIPKDGEWCCHWVNDQPIGREGFLTVGDHKKPTVIVDDWRLPPGWTKHMYQRSNVLGKWDVILVNSNNKRFRSKADLKQYIEDLGQHYNPDVYDFSIHRRRAKDIGAYVYTKDYKPPQPVKPPPPPLEPLPPLQPQSLMHNAGQQNSSIQSLLSTSSPPLFEPTSGKGGEDESMQLEDGYVYVGSLKVRIIDNLFRCPKENCNKNFRKENHLQIHIKHYHDDIAKFLGDCPNMQELACKRTIGHPPDEPLPKNYLPNSQYFAKLHQQDLQNRMHRKSISAPHAPSISTPTRHEASDSFLMSTTADDSSKLLEPSISDSIVGSGTVPSSPAVASPSFVHSTGDEMSTPLIEEQQKSAPQLQPQSHSKVASRKTGERKSSRQRLQKKYVTATTSNVFDNSFHMTDFEETRHSFNGTPEHHKVTKKAKLSHPTFVQDPNLDGNTTSSVPDQPHSQSPKYIQENGEVIKIVRMRSEEIINCICSFGEEDGLMIQCELCLCWQHGICNGIEKESQVPEKYVCYICKNPALGRASMKYVHDQDWLYEGRLPTGNYHASNPKLQDRFNMLRTSHTLTGNLIELKRFLHSLRVKINIAENKDHPKMYLWAKKWESSPPRAVERKVEKFEDIETINPDKKEASDADVKEELDREVGGDGQAEVKAEGENAGASECAEKMETEDKQQESLEKPKEEIKVAQQPNIPQPEAAIDPVECQLRLLEHIQKQQSLVVERLQDIESDIVELESLDPSNNLDTNEFSRTKQTLAILIKDLEIMQNIAKINTVPPTSYVPYA